MHISPEVYMAKRDPEHDPFVLGLLTKPKALTLNEDFTTTIDTETGEAIYADKDVQALAEFYLNNLVRKDVITQTTVAEGVGEIAKPVWDKKCYLMGLQSADESNNPNVAQTIGWNSTFGGAGRFDPLSLTPDNSSNKNVNTGQ